LESLKDTYRKELSDNHNFKEEDAVEFFFQMQEKFTIAERKYHLGIIAGYEKKIFYECPECGAKVTADMLKCPQCDTLLEFIDETDDNMIN